MSLSAEQFTALLDARQIASFDWPSQATVDAYADLAPGAWSKIRFRWAAVVFRNTGANGAHVKLLGSVDGSSFGAEVLAETVVAAGAQFELTISDYWPYLKPQIKAQVAASQTNVEAHGAAIES